MPVVAKGWLTIGQFSDGFVNILQFGLGPFCLSQFAPAGVAVSQICTAVLAFRQRGVASDRWGQVLVTLAGKL